ncbi:MAG: sensor histidine kinase [Actinomycetota bacterium]
MSATTATANHRRTKVDPIGLRVWFWTSSLIVVGTLLSRGDDLWVSLQDDIGYILLWTIAMAFADYLEVRFWRGVHLTMSLTVGIAAAMVFNPVVAASIAFVGSLDPREVRGEMPLRRALYNRSQVAAAVGLSSVVFHQFQIPVMDWPMVLAPAAIAIVVDGLVNTAAVVVPVCVFQKSSPAVVIRGVFQDVPVLYVLVYLGLGLFGVLLATVTEAAGAWGLAGFLVPLVLARHTLLQAERLNDSSRKLQSQSAAFLESTQRIADERRDERMVVAGELHDEVLPPLFKVHLMGQVLRQDLDSGQLLNLDSDLPELLSAIQAAQEAIRQMVGDLRRSSIGSAGLCSTIKLLAQQLESAGSPRITLELADVGGSKLTQLLIYQVAREAMNNAARHSRATEISVRLWREEGIIRLVVGDDGVGFDARAVDRNSHFGLQLISERVEAARGRVAIESRLGEGTTIAATLPLEL